MEYAFTMINVARKTRDDQNVTRVGIQLDL
jgi:hypothetical protein